MSSDTSIRETTTAPTGAVNLRQAGAGLLVYGLGVTAAFMSVGAPGGDYEQDIITRYIASSHWALAFTLSYVAAFAALGLMLVGTSLRGVGKTVGPMLWGMSVAGTAASVVGAFITGGIDVSMAEGGKAVQQGVALPVVYLVSEIGNLLTVCAPAFFAGVIAVVVAVRPPSSPRSMPGWLRVFTLVAGVCGILAPFFFTYFVFVLWTIVAGVALLVAGSRAGGREGARARSASLV